MSGAVGGRGGRLLVRAHKNPTRVADARTTLRRNLIGNNAGNLVFSHAVCRLLSVADVDITTARLPPRTSFTAERINAEFDRLVLPLANAFRAGFLDNLRTLTSLVEGLTIPVTVLGVGAQAGLDGSDTQPAQVHAQVARFVAAVLDRVPVDRGARRVHPRLPARARVRRGSGAGDRLSLDVLARPGSRRLTHGGPPGTGVADRAERIRVRGPDGTGHGPQRRALSQLGLRRPGPGDPRAAGPR